MMTANMRTLTLVWVFLVAVTVAAWWIGRSTDAPWQINHVITYSVLLIAAIKSRLVMRYFMEVRHAPSWLKWSCDGWLGFVFLMLFGFYWASN